MIKLGNDEYEIEGYTKLKKNTSSSVAPLPLPLFGCTLGFISRIFCYNSFALLFTLWYTRRIQNSEFRIQNPESSLTQQNLQHNVAFSPDVIYCTSWELENMAQFLNCIASSSLWLTSWSTSISTNIAILASCSVAQVHDAMHNILMQ